MSNTTTTSKPREKVARSQDEVLKLQAEQQKQFKEARRKSIIKMLAGASIVPVGLYAFSKYKGFDGKKTAKVTIIGSVIIFGAVVINGFSGAFSGNSISDRLLASIGIGKKNKKITDKDLMSDTMIPLNTPRQPVEIKK